MMILSKTVLVYFGRLRYGLFDPHPGPPPLGEGDKGRIMSGQEACCMASNASSDEA
jgi:hypothetical protein